jgi:hypothetical protein
MKLDLDQLAQNREIEELAGSPEDAHAGYVNARLLETHTMIPGIIQSFDPVKQTCTARPAIQRVFVGKGPVALPVCVDVPCCFPGGALSFEVAEGDDCALFFAERCIDAWFAQGGVQPPIDFRTHDLSDAFAVTGWNSLPNKLADLYQGGSELRLRDGTNRLSVRKDGTVHIGTQASVSIFVPLVNGTVLGKGIDTLTGTPYGVLGNASMTVMAKP